MSVRQVSSVPEAPRALRETRAVVFEEPRRLALRRLALPGAGPGQVVVDVEWSGISTGTEKLLWSGRMPPFPGMGYPLVPGYETVGRVVATGPGTERRLGERVFVSGARCFGDIHGLFGGAASRLVVDEAKALPLAEGIGEEATLLALAATAQHALQRCGDDLPADLVVGHGVLGRLVARLQIVQGHAPPVVWERDAARARASGYRVVDPDSDTRRDYRRIIDVSGDPGILDTLVQRLAPRGDIVLAGFYPEALSFAFPAAFMREASIRIAAQWRQDDLIAVRELLESGRLDVSDLISHRVSAHDAQRAYESAFSDPACLKMILDWRNL